MKVQQEIKKGVFVTICYGIWSSIENNDFFKEILISLYDITQCSPKNLILEPNNTILETITEHHENSSSHKNSINNRMSNISELEYTSSNPFSNEIYESFHYFKLSEFMNFVIFITKIIKPPAFTNIEINFHLSSTELYMHSLFDIPNKDSSIQILLDCLELSTIIKLWCALLMEKHVILLGMRGLLYPACSALLSLLFPLKWMHTYIPVFPDYYEIELLEAPTPYFIGVPRERVDFNELCNEYRHHVICDLTTNQISKTEIILLPEEDEIKLRTKVRFLRYPKLDILEDINDEKDIGLVPDVDPNESFPRNIQFIFCRIFRDNLKGFEKFLNKKYQFNQQIFLDNLESTALKTFWTEITNSQAFENFIVGYKKLDDENTLRFKNLDHIIDLTDRKWSIDNSFKMKLRIPDTTSYIFGYIKEIIQNKIIDSEIKLNETIINHRNSFNQQDNVPEMKDLIEFLEFLEINYSLVVEEIKSQKNDLQEDVFNNLFNISKGNFIYGNEKLKSNNLNAIERAYSSNSPFGPSLSKASSISKKSITATFMQQEEFKSIKKFGSQYIKKSYVKDKNDLDKSSSKEGNETFSSQEEVTILIPNDSEFCFYGNLGFLKFSKRIFKFLKNDQIEKITLKPLIYKNLQKYFYDNQKIIKFKIKCFCTNCKEKKPNLCEQINITKNLKQTTSNNIFEKKNSQNNEIFDKSNSSNSNLLDDFSLISVTDSNKAQYYSVMAYLFEQYFPENVELIFNFYFMSCFSDNFNFPQLSYYVFLNTFFNIEQIQSITDATNLNILYDITKFVLEQKKKLSDKNKKKRKKSDKKLVKHAYIMDNEVSKDFSLQKTINSKKSNFKEKDDTSVVRTSFKPLNNKEILERSMMSSMAGQNINCIKTKIEIISTTDSEVEDLIVSPSHKIDRDTNKCYSDLNEKEEKEEISELDTINCLSLNTNLKLKEESKRKPHKVSEELAQCILDMVKFFSFDKHKKQISKPMIKDLVSNYSEFKKIDLLANELGVRFLQ